MLKEAADAAAQVKRGGVRSSEAVSLAYGDKSARGARVRDIARCAFFRHAICFSAPPSVLLLMIKAATPRVNNILRSAPPARRQDTRLVTVTPCAFGNHRGRFYVDRVAISSERVMRRRVRHT